jgi:type II secretory pathway pseudopilin PulG
MLSIKNMESWIHNNRVLFGGFALVEVMVAAMLIGLVAVGSVQTLDRLNRNASSNRVITNARAVVQRNIDSALSVTCQKDSIPPILTLTPAAGQMYDDDAGVANVVTVAQRGTSSAELAAGTLTRIVTAVPNADGADIRQVTFRLDYSYRGRPDTYALTTFRAIDD